MTANRTATRRGLVGLILLAACGPAGGGAATAAAPDGQAGPTFYVRKDTWVESLRASYEAMIRGEAEAARRLDHDVKADPALRGFRALTLETSPGQAPARVRVRVSGLKVLYIRAESAEADGRRSGRVRLAGPRLIAADGAETPLTLTREQLAGRYGTRSVHTERKPFVFGEREFAGGVDLSYGRDGGVEIAVALDGKYEWLDAWAGAPQQDNRPGQKGRLVVDCRPLLALKDKAVEDRQTIRRLVGRDFCDPVSAREQRLEKLARIWEGDQPPTGVGDLAARYARACKEAVRKTAVAQAASAKTEADLRAVRGLFYFGHGTERLELAGRTLAFVERSRRLPKLAAELAAAEQAFEQFTRRPGPNGRELYLGICRLRRKIILSHPLLDFDRLLINKRPPPNYSHMCDQYLGRHSRLGPGLVVLDDWKDKPRETLLLEGKLPPGSVLHPDLSYDARRVLFSYCDHSVKDQRCRRFFIHEIGIDGSHLRQLTGTASDPLAGWDGRHTVLIEDFDPCYLPDGSIVFITTRSQNFGRCHGGRYTPAYLLYRMGPDGSGIHQISFGEANEWDPSVMHDGRIVYTRWDYINRHDTIFQSLWTMHPDGTATAHYYGNYSRAPCMIAESRSVPGSHKVVATTTAHHGYTTGSTILIDPLIGRDDLEPLTRVTPEISFPEAPDRGTFVDGAFATPWPLSEDLFLTAYTPDRRVGQGSVQAVNAYSIYLVDMLGGRELIYRDPNMSCFTPIPIQPRPRPPVLSSTTAGGRGAKTGLFFVQDVYRSTQPIERGSIKSIRVNRIYCQPTASHPHRSRVNNEVTKGILGTVPVGADGSTAFRAPAGVPMQLQVLDANGMAVMTMRSVVYLQPGEVSGCVGCHEPRHATSRPPAGRAGPRIHDITPPAGPKYEGGFSFVRTVQPVLDRYCIRCHGLNAGKVAGDLNLLGTPADGFNAAYCSLMDRKGLVRIAQRNGETWYSKPKDYFAHAGKLVGHLTGRHREKVRLDRESFRRIVDWLDVNAQFYGDYSRNRLEDRGISKEGEKALREHVRGVFGEELAAQPFAALVNAATPTESRILKAPLAAEAGGWGQITKGGWRDTREAGYREMLKLVTAAVEPLEYHDIAGGCGHRHCRCGSCWVRKAEEDYRESLAAKARIAGRDESR